MENDCKQRAVAGTRIGKPLLAYLIFVVVCYAAEWFISDTGLLTPENESLIKLACSLSLLGAFFVYLTLPGGKAKNNGAKILVLEKVTLYCAMLGVLFTPILLINSATSPMEDSLIYLLTGVCLYAHSSIRHKHIRNGGSLELEEEKGGIRKKDTDSKKLIIVQGVSLEKLDKVIKENCVNYINPDGSNSMQLWRLEQSKFAITFPRGIDYPKTFLYVVEDLSIFLGTPNAHKDIMGWTETKELKKLPGEMALYRFDSGKDAVYATTEDGQTWRQNSNVLGKIFDKDNGHAVFIPRPEIDWEAAEKLTLYDKKS